MPTATRSRARRCYAYGHGDVPSQALHRRARAGRLAGRGAGARGRRGRWQRRDVHRCEQPQAGRQRRPWAAAGPASRRRPTARGSTSRAPRSPRSTPTTRATLGTVALPAASTIAVSTDGARVYAAHKGGITVVNTMAPAPVLGPTIKLPGSPQAIAVSSDGTRAVVTQTRGRAVVIDLVGFKVLRRLKVTRPAGVAFAPRSSRAWVVSAGTAEEEGPPRRHRHRRPASRRRDHPRPRPRRRHRLLARRHPRHRRRRREPGPRRRRLLPRPGLGRLAPAHRQGLGLPRLVAGRLADLHGRPRLSGTLSVLSGFRYGRLSTVRLGFPPPRRRGPARPRHAERHRRPRPPHRHPRPGPHRGLRRRRRPLRRPRQRRAARRRSATTSSPAAPPTTCSTAARATTASPARPATTSSSAAWATT